MKPLTQILLNSPEIVEILESQFPPKCVEPGQSLEDAHRYAGKVELVQMLRDHLNDGLRRIEKERNSVRVSQAGRSGDS